MQLYAHAPLPMQILTRSSSFRLLVRLVALVHERRHCRWILSRKAAKAVRQRQRRRNARRRRDDVHAAAGRRDGDELAVLGHAAALLREVEDDAAPAKATPQLWHRRYGHMGYDNMAKLQADQLVDGIKPSANDFKAAGDALCEPCVKAKHHKISRGPSNTNTDNPLELVHMDVCGPFQERHWAAACTW